MKVFSLEKILWLSAITLIFSAGAGSSQAATPSAEQALKLAPMQSGVDYDKPTAEQMAKCKISPKKIDGRVGWIVEGPDGGILRQFVDTNGDNVVDQWSYYKDGLEVYRDVDTNFNGKADQYRWFNTGGSRWAIDKNEDGVIDAWKSISAEEVSAEVVAAIATHDAGRFARLLITPEELKSLGLGKTHEAGVAEKVGKASAEFKAMTSRQKAVTDDAQWVQFSAGRPGIVPIGTDGSTKEVRVYENATAIYQAGEKNNQVQIGTLIQVGDLWRAIDMPIPPDDGQTASANSGYFFQASMRKAEAAGGEAGDSAQKLLADLEQLDKEASQAATPEDRASITTRRAEMLEQIADAAKTPDERGMWLRQLADMLSAAVQSGEYPDGAERLKSLVDKLQKSDTDKDLASYVKFRQLTADYVLSMQAKNADYSKIQSEWLKTLEQYINEFPTSADAAEAMLQLAISQEFMGKEDDAKNWYVRIVKEFPDSAPSKKAAGAQARLESVGKPIALSGRSPTGGAVDLAKYRGKAVLIQYWATWSSPAKSDMATLKELVGKYGKSFAVIGVSLDNNVKDLNAYLSENPLPWQQIYEEGGMDSRPANVLGVLTVPTMILVDPQGKVVDRNIAISDVESAVKKLLK